MTEKESRCTCGQPGAHGHLIDGEEVQLCGLCHAALVFIKQNSFGCSIVTAIKTAEADENGLDVFQRVAAEPPKQHYKPTPPVVPVPAPVAVAPIDEEALVPVFLPVPEDLNERFRKPPEIDPTSHEPSIL